MRIVSCHITGYGKFKNVDMDFKRGLNVIEEDNGWGKSTLCSFIKAMFYGNPTDKKRALNDRRQYRPWDKSVYGGNLTFEVDDKSYRVERFFGSNAKDDTFALYDLSTNLESSDYSENLGEELFGIDRDSFAKSVYVPQNAIKPEMTGAINGKLGDLVTVQDDINNFDEAIKRIDAEKSIYTKKGKDENRGKIVKIEDTINDLREDVERLDSYKESLRMNERLLEEKQNIRGGLEKEKEELRNRITRQSDRDQLTGEYNLVLKTYTSEKENLDELDDFFTNGVPSDEEIGEYFELTKEVDVLQSRCDDIQNKMPDKEKTDLLKEMFKEPLSDEVIDDWLDRANKLSELRVLSEHAKLSDEDRDALQELKYYFAKKKPTKEELEIVRNEAENVNRLQGRVEETKGYYEQQKHIFEEGVKNKSSDSKSALAMLMIVGAIILVGSIVSLVVADISQGIIIGIAGIVISIIIFAVGIVGNKRRNTNSKKLVAEMENNYNEAKEKYEQAKGEYDTSEKICREFLSDFLVNANETMQQMILDIELKAEKYDTLIANEEKAVEVGGNALEELTSLEMSLYTELAHYQACYRMEDLYSSNAEIELIQRIKEDNNIYRSYIEDDRERSKLIEQREANLKKITSYLNRFPVIDAENVSQKIAFVKAKKQQYEDIAQKVAGHKEFIDKYEKANEAFDETQTVEELQNRQAEIDEKLRSIGDDINQINVRIRDVKDAIDKCQESSNQIDELKEEMKEYQKKVNYLIQTKEYLTKAKDKFLSTYMRPLQKGMREYLDRLETENTLIRSENYSIDTKLAISINYEGETKEEGYLSRGYGDMAAFCARLALIDIMYEGQKPMIVLDDPFTQMDEEKIKMALKLIEDLSKEKQILYFACHKSRV